jgi:aldehyde dehydrogenase
VQTLSDEQVERIAQRLAASMQLPPGATPECGPDLQVAARGTAAGTMVAPVDTEAAAAPGLDAGTKAQCVPDLRDGVFPTVAAAVEAALTAFRRLQGETLELRARLIQAMRAAFLAEAEALAQRAHEETGYGRYEDKARKNRLVALKCAGIEDLRPAALTGDHGLALCEPAPYGVIGAITPVTNPSSTLIGNAISMIAAGNSVVFNVHPGAYRVGAHTVQVLNRAIMRAGGPVNLATLVAEPTIATAQALMTHPAVRLLAVTGGEAVVHAAMRSGKRAICAGPGNPPVVVDETADIDAAARDIVRGASFDNNVICVDEKEVFAVASIADGLLAGMRRHGACVLDAAQLREIETLIFERTEGPGRPGVIRKELIGKDAAVILARLGVRAAPEVRLVVVEVPAAHPLVWTEQMLPVLPVVRAANADQAIDLAVAAEGGRGHTASMHSRHLDHLSRMARSINCSIFVKNAPCYAGLGEGGEGYCSFTIASPTGEGPTGPRSFSRMRRCVLVDHFRIV